MSETTDPTRRSFLTASAIGAGASAIGALSLDAALATSAGASPVGSDGGSTATLEAFGGGTEALPVRIPGARMGVATWIDAQPHAFAAAAEKGFANGGVYSLNGWLSVNMPMAPGSRLLQIDAYAKTTVSGFLTPKLIQASPSAGVNSGIVNFETNTGLGVVQGTHTPDTPILVGNAEKYYLELFGTTIDKVFLGAVYQYFDANPQLNMLAAPIRVYDSRPGNLPNVGTKLPLANAASRSVDCKFGNGVPAGAAAALVQITAVTGSANGFMALYKNGIGWPGNSSVNWDHVGVVSATTVVALDDQALLQAYVASGASSDFIVDVIGFYA